MESEKKSKKSVPVLVLAFLLIVAGVVLIVTGNNKSFLSEEKTNEKETTKEEEKTTEDEPNKGIVPQSVALTNQEALSIIAEKKNTEFSSETWVVENVVVLAHDEKNEKFLIQYDKVDESNNVTVMQAIITILGDQKYVEFPGWVPGEHDLTVYNFIYEQVEQDYPTTDKDLNPTEEDPTSEVVPPIQDEEPNTQTDSE